MDTVTVDYNDVALEVSGFYSPMVPSRDSAIEPDAESEFEVEKIEVGGVDILQIFTSEQLIRITEKALDAMEGNTPRRPMFSPAQVAA